MNRVIIISPYAGKSIQEIADNLKYAQACMKDCFNKDESPIAFHLLYPQVFDDSIPEQRQKAMEAAQEWFDLADYCVVYEDLGKSKGMKEEIKFCDERCITVEYRKLLNA